jgi:hypothetical protein
MGYPAEDLSQVTEDVAERFTVKRIDPETGDLPEFSGYRESRVPLRKFHADDMTLQPVKPLTIRVSKGEELWFAENDKLDIFAVGESPEEALSEFSKHLIYFYRHYRSKSENELMGRALELKRVFEDSFMEVTPA